MGCVNSTQYLPARCGECNTVIYNCAPRAWLSVCCEGETESVLQLQTELTMFTIDVPSFAADFRFTVVNNRKL